MTYRKTKKYAATITAAALLCGTLTAASIGSAVNVSAETTGSSATVSSSSNTESEIYEDFSDGGHAIEADGTEETYSGISVNKTGEAEGDKADFYGENAAVFATNGASLTIEDAAVNTEGTHANGIFSYGEGTVVKISDSEIETSGNCSGGLMVTGGGTLEAENLTIHTTGNSSAAIRSDRGGGTETVTGGSYTTEGTGSPVIYSTADVTVTDAAMTSTASQGVVVEGKNSVTLQNVTLTADNNTKNSDKSDTYQAVMIYQSMSGDAAEGEASFSMEGGSLTNKNGDIFFVNNTIAAISLSGAEITNEDSEGVFLRAEAAGWGNEGSNGGHVTLNAENQDITGDMIVDEISTLNLYLNGNSAFEGAVNPDGAAGEVYAQLEADAIWTLTGDSWISSLTCDEDSIDLNGYTLYVNGEAYEEGTSSEGSAVTVEIPSAAGRGGRPEMPPEGSDGERPEMPPEGMDGERPEMPQKGMDGERPEMPGGNSHSRPEGERPESSDVNQAEDGSTSQPDTPEEQA